MEEGGAGETKLGQGRGGEERGNGEETGWGWPRQGRTGEQLASEGLRALYARFLFFLSGSLRFGNSRKEYALQISSQQTGTVS